MSNVTWYFKEGPLPNNAIELGSFDGYAHALMIQNVQLNNTGIYSCRGHVYQYLTESEGTLRITSMLLRLIHYILERFLFVLLNKTRVHRAHNPSC